MTVITNLVIELWCDCMGVAFTEHEKNVIKAKLIDAAQECMQKYGIKKTTVEQLAQKAGISKGAFYLFYPSKEILFFKVLEAFQIQITQELSRRLSLSQGTNKERISDVIYNLYESVKNSFILSIIENNEYEYLVRKLPPEYLVQHQSLDDLFTKEVFASALTGSEYETEVISAAFRAIFMTMLHQKEIGVQYYDAVLKLLITALTDQIIKE